VLNSLKAKAKTTTTKERNSLPPPSFHLYLDMPEETFMKEDLDVKVIKTKLLWMLSFIWEDFRVSATKDTLGLTQEISSILLSEYI
jgi:hypothetical protein